MVKGNNKLDVNRVNAITEAVRGVAFDVLEYRTKADAAKTAANLARAEVYSRQSDALLTLAAAASDGQWSDAEILKARSVITSQQSDKTTLKTLQNFLSYASTAMAPTVRPHASDLWDLCLEAWRTEEDTRAIDKEAPTPFKLAFKRLDNMFVAALTLAKGTKDHKATLLTCQNDLDMWAAANDPALDVEKVKARLDAARDALSAFAHDFPFDKLTNVMASLSEISPKDVEAAWQNIHGAASYTFGVPTPQIDADSDSYLEAVKAQDAAEEAEEAKAQITEPKVKVTESEPVTDSRVNDAVDELTN